MKLPGFGDGIIKSTIRGKALAGVLLPFATAIMTGMRIGEALALNWSETDYKTVLLRVIYKYQV